MRLDDAAGFVFDVDGTLVHRAGNELHVQPGAAEVLARIRASGRPFAIFTNGTYEPPEAFAAGLRSAGLDVADDELLTPLQSVRAYLDANRLDGGVQLIGTEASREYLLRVGLPLVGRRGRRCDLRRHARRGRLRGARAGRAGGARRGAAADGQLRAGLRGRRRTDLQPRRDDDRRAREGHGRSTGHRRQAVGGGAPDDQRPARGADGRAGRDRGRPRHGHRSRQAGRRADDPRAQRDQRDARARAGARGRSAPTRWSTGSPSCSTGSSGRLRRRSPGTSAARSPASPARGCRSGRAHP